MIRTFFLCLFLTLAAGPVLAQDHKAAIERLFTDDLNTRRQALEAQGRTLRTEGVIRIEPRGKYYAVTLPHLSVHKPDGSYVDIGIVSVNVSPGKTAGTWAMSFAIPTPIHTYGSEKQMLSKTELGKQSFNGLWDESLGGLSKLDARYHDVRVTNIRDNVTITVPVVTAFINLAKNGELWGGEQRYSLQNISLQKKDDPGISKIGQINMTSTVAGLDVRELRALQKKSADMARPASAVQAAGDTLPYYNAVFDFIGSAMERFDTSIEIHDIDLRRPAMAGSPEGHIKAKSIHLDMNGSNLRTNDTMVGTKLRYEDLTLAPMPPHLQGILPSTLSLDTSLVKLPLKDMIALAKNQIVLRVSGHAGPADNEVKTLAARAGTRLIIRDSMVGNVLYKLILSGDMAASTTNPVGATGTLKANFEGMDDLVKTLQARLMDNKIPIENRQKLTGATMLLTTMQILGKQEKSPAGKDSRIYDIVIDPQGAITLNGQSLEALKALMPKPKP